MKTINTFNNQRQASAIATNRVLRNTYTSLLDAMRAQG